MCDKRYETVQNFFSDRSQLAQTGYKKCDDKVATMAYWELCSIFDFEPAKHWYKH